MWVPSRNPNASSIASDIIKGDRDNNEGVLHYESVSNF